MRLPEYATIALWSLLTTELMTRTVSYRNGSDTYIWSNTFVPRVGWRTICDKPVDATTRDSDSWLKSPAMTISTGLWLIQSRLIHDFTAVTLSVKVGVVRKNLTLTWSFVKFHDFLRISTNLMLFTKIFYLPVEGNDILVCLLPNCCNQLLIHIISILISQSSPCVVCHSFSYFNCMFVSKCLTKKNPKNARKYFITLQWQNIWKSPWTFCDI